MAAATVAKMGAVAAVTEEEKVAGMAAAAAEGVEVEVEAAVMEAEEAPVVEAEMEGRPSRERQLVMRTSKRPDLLGERAVSTVAFGVRSPRVACLRAQIFQLLAPSPFPHFSSFHPSGFP